MDRLTHIDDKGRPRMVDVSGKEDTKRVAVAAGSIYMQPDTLRRIAEGRMAKGDVLSVAQTAGIMAAKNTAQTIPMCHNIFLTGVEMDFVLDEAGPGVHITARTETVGKTGVEMEALHAVAAAALTIYDMCKAVDRAMTIGNIRLLRKEGGKSGLFVREGEGEDGMARVLAINISEKTGTVKQPVEQAEFRPGGIVGDAHFGVLPKREVSLLGNESVDKMRGQGVDLTFGIFAENITTEGIDLKNLPIGTKLRIGETLQEVTQIGKECHHGCEIRQKIGTCVMPTEGIFTRVLEGGVVKTGDEIRVEE